jgi:hypothetical protein
MFFREMLIWTTWCLRVGVRVRAGVRAMVRVRVGSGRG